MSTAQLIMRDADQRKLRDALIQEDQKERAAFLLFGTSRAIKDPWDKKKRTKYLLREIILLPEEAMIESTRSSITWDNNFSVSVLKRAKAQSLVAGIIHSHPEGAVFFSGTDDEGEKSLWELAAHRNGTSTEILSVILTRDGTLLARVWRNKKGAMNIDHVSILGDRFIFLHRRLPANKSPALHRQMLAFGQHLVDVLSQLRVGVIGCGGTGSAVAMLLARLGVGRLLLIDDDVVEITNLNRLHGATENDARRKRAKVEVLKRLITQAGLKTKVKVYKTHVGDLQVRDALKACDLVFGCTDDNQGRLLLNRLAYFYLLPVIDMGLSISLTKGDSPAIESLDGRVTVLFPGSTCLLCRGVIRADLARAEYLKRANLEEYERQKDEAYVVGEGNPNPSVVTFTTEVATMALNELLHRVQGFRGEGGATSQRTRLFHRMHDLRQGDPPNPDCPICSKQHYWGRGDIEPFLDQVN